MAQYYQLQIGGDVVLQLASDDGVSTYNRSQPLHLQDDQIVLNEGQQLVYQTSPTAPNAAYQQQAAATNNFDMTQRTTQSSATAHYISNGNEDISQQQSQHQQIVLQQHQAIEQQHHHAAQQQTQQHYMQDPQQQLTQEHQLQHVQQQQQQHQTQQQQQTMQQAQTQQVFYTTATTAEQLLHTQQQQQQQADMQQQMHIEQQQQQQQGYQQQQRQQHALQAQQPQQQQIIYRMSAQQQQQPQQHHPQLTQSTQMLNNHVIVPSGHQVMIQSSPSHHILQQQQQQQQQQNHQRIIYNGARLYYTQTQQQPQQQQQHIHLQTNSLHGPVQPGTTRLVRVATPNTLQTAQHSQTHQQQAQQVHQTAGVVFQSIQSPNMQAKTIIHQQQEQQQQQQQQVQQMQLQQQQQQTTQTQLIAAANHVRSPAGIRAKVARGGPGGSVVAPGTTLIARVPNPVSPIRGGIGAPRLLTQSRPLIIKNSRQRATAPGGGQPRGRAGARGGGRGAASGVGRGNSQIVSLNELVANSGNLQVLDQSSQQSPIGGQNKNVTITMGHGHGQLKQVQVQRPQQMQQIEHSQQQQQSPTQMQYVHSTMASTAQAVTPARFRSPSLGTPPPSSTQGVLPMATTLNNSGNNSGNFDLEESIRAAVVKKDAPVVKKAIMTPTAIGGGVGNVGNVVNAANTGGNIAGSGATLTSYYNNREQNVDDDNRFIRTNNGTCMTLTEYKKRTLSQSPNQTGGMNVVNKSTYATIRSTGVSVVGGGGGTVPGAGAGAGTGASQTAGNVPLPTNKPTMATSTMGAATAASGASTQNAQLASGRGALIKPSQTQTHQHINTSTSEQQQNPTCTTATSTTTASASAAAATSSSSSSSSSSSAVHQIAHNNYEIQTQYVLQNRSGQQMAEKDRNSAKMLVILVSGEQRLITFTLPRESCTVQDLLEQVGVNFDSNTTIQCVESPGANIDFVVTVGFSVHESASELISRAEQSLQINRQQDTNPASAAATAAAAAASSTTTTVASSTGSLAASSGSQSGNNNNPAVTGGAANANASLPDAISGCDSESSKDSLSQSSSSTTGSKTAADSVPRKLISGYYAVCQSCGFSGLDHAKCERCRRVFLEPPKRVACVKNSSITGGRDSTTSTNAAVGSAADKKRMFTEPMTRGAKFLVSTPYSSNNVSLRGRPPGSIGPRNSRLPRTSRKAAEAEPVILTLSSDEEDDENIKKNTNVNANISNNLVGKGVIVQKSFSFEQFAPHIDETALYTSFKRSDVTDLSDSLGVKLSAVFRCKTIYIGTHSFQPPEEVIFTSKGLRIVAPQASNSDVTRTLNIQLGEIVRVIGHFSCTENSLILVYLAGGCAQYIRNVLDMKDQGAPSILCFRSNGSYRMRKIIMECESLPDGVDNIIRIIVPIIDEISIVDAQQLLQHVKESKSLLAAGHTIDESNSAVTIATSNTSITTIQLNPNDIRQLLIYPPGKGGISINTEDYMCLATDQYLNDIIIDFYLKWIHNNVIPTQEERDKTFIFSTFFYKRLTTMTRHTHNFDKDVKQTAAQKRHARVQNWTKNVNLFEKDFIIIPINEQSHWFLAIICFPQLTGPVTFDTHTPVDPQEIKKQRGKKLTLTIGNTTITPLSKRSESLNAATANLVANYGSGSGASGDADDGSERDEAEGDDSDLASEDSSDIDLNATVAATSTTMSSSPAPLTAASSSSATTPTTSNMGNDNVGKSNNATPPNSKSTDASGIGGGGAGGGGAGGNGDTGTNSRINTNERNTTDNNGTGQIRAIKQPLILIFDSLAGASRSRVVATLRDYLTCEYKSKMPNSPPRIFSKDNMTGHCVKVPQQNNFTDCGLFLLQYVEQFYKDPIKDYRTPIKQLANWFDTIIVTRKREEISNLLKTLLNEKHDKLGAKEKYLLPDIPFPTLNGELVEQPENSNPEFEEEDMLEIEARQDDMDEMEQLQRDIQSEDTNDETSMPATSVSITTTSVAAANTQLTTLGGTSKRIVLKRRIHQNATASPTSTSTSSSTSTSTPTPSGGNNTDFLNISAVSSSTPTPTTTSSPNNNTNTVSSSSSSNNNSSCNNNNSNNVTTTRSAVNNPSKLRKLE